jgi:hypothetical protein
MPSWFPNLSYVYTEENGFSWGLGVSAGKLTGRDLSVSARVYFGDLNSMEPDLLALDLGQPRLLRLLRREQRSRHGQQDDEEDRQRPT